MKRSGRLVRILRAVTVLSAATVAAIAFIPVAQAAVTNPADNPHRIVVKGDDGNTYVDGQDTLPGYDDEECTYIPGAYYDFANNRVRYADGQSIPWTEWDRATGYKEWLAQQQKGASASAAAAVVASAPRVVGAPKATAKPSTSAVSVSQASVSAAPSAVSQASVQPTKTSTAFVNVQPVAARGKPVPQVVGLTHRDSNLDEKSGFVILGALSALGLLTTGGHEVRRRLTRKGQL